MKIHANWEKIKKFSDNFSDNSQSLNKLINEMETTINSLSSSWQGVDYDNFVGSMNLFVDKLKKESFYLDDWSIFLKRTSLKYGGHVEEGVSRVRNLQNQYDFEKGVDLSEW